MAFRHLYIEHSAHISQKLNNLIIKLEHDSYRVPISDIETLIIDNLRSNITVNALSKLSLDKVLVIVCNHKHLPCFMGLPINNYFHRLPIITKQFKLPSEIRKRLWKNIIKQKIRNEILTLSLLGVTHLSFLKKMKKNVVDGDENHCEAPAAKFYFQKLFGKNFNRRNSNPINGMLNYGYSLVRGLISRDICSYGLEPSIGLFHHNMLNSFNLADDLIEPFRSVVDLFICQHLWHWGNNLVKDNRQKLLKIMNLNVLINNRAESLTNAVHIEVSSFNRCILRKSSSILLPKLIPLKEHK